MASPVLCTRLACDVEADPTADEPSSDPQPTAHGACLSASLRRKEGGKSPAGPMGVGAGGRGSDLAWSKAGSLAA